MDPYKLLSRSSKRGAPQKSQSTPSSGAQAAPPSNEGKASSGELPSSNSRKRKRKSTAAVDTPELEFFGGSSSKAVRDATRDEAHNENSDDEELEEDEAEEQLASGAGVSSLSVEERKNILHKHKLKATWINPPAPQKKERRKKNLDKKKVKVEKSEKIALFPQPLQSFAELRPRFGVSGRLATNIDEQGYTVPTEVQLAALPLLLDDPKNFMDAGPESPPHIDILTVAPTGSGKTMAFMIPTLQRISKARQGIEGGLKTTSAVILAPTKELASQIVNEGRKLARNTGIKVTQVRKGMELAARPKTGDGEDDDEPAKSKDILVKSDVLVSTPGVLASIIQEAKENGREALSDVQYLILDEADVLLDPLFREQTLTIWNSLNRPDLRVSLWSATMGSNIEELARTVLNERRQRLSDNQQEPVPEAPLVRLVVGLKDSAVPNIQHRLVYAASEQGKLMGLRQLLHPTTTSSEAGPPLLPPFLVFTQTIERAIALHSELLYDIPAEAGGISRIAVLHSDLSDTARDNVMTGFRKGEIWILITTDLLSRGVDFRGVNGVVNYDIPTSSAAYVHRVGRTGRAGREGGVAVTLYSKEDIPYLKNVANVVAAAQKQKGGGFDATNKDGVQQWLLDALPDLSKQAKKDLRKHGVESRTSRGMTKDSKAGRKARISTKSGFERREENKRKGMIQGSKQRQEAAAATAEDQGEETDFGGFD
ncbi:related to ATP-dependent RNA helicase rok1 [Ramularia collo-cygni]|uniref:ATP-dependent RNA helicase n=1 Tax=Ramularia collo-cygni TaxID=112498 RepID=A0A2D3UUA9_9PEZI|nr:related to ATP-dependent RNA helicase rok1 [Ramularia collo-cygni]CZT20151.1 related to ATP-dependent RNA helicase rok1 [Ramularia collo-cygni]